jgi:hypothetical protein
MSEKNRKVGEVNYATNKIPKDYRCDYCNVHGVKLWREYNTIADATKLLCVHCTKIDQQESVAKFGGRCFPEYGDQIGSFIPAVPTEGDDTYWGYTSVPEDGVNWWKNLSTEIGGYKVVNLAEFEKIINSSEWIIMDQIIVVISVCQDLGLRYFPEAWIPYIQSGWRLIKQLDSWMWGRPLPSGSISLHGEVKYTQLDVSRLLDTKRDFSNSLNKILVNYRPGKKDVGKIFYLKAEPGINEKPGVITTREKLLQVDPLEIRFWIEITDLDIIDVE